MYIFRPSGNPIQFKGTLLLGFEKSPPTTAAAYALRAIALAVAAFVVFLYLHSRYRVDRRGQLQVRGKVMLAFDEQSLLNIQMQQHQVISRSSSFLEGENEKDHLCPPSRHYGTVV